MAKRTRKRVVSGGGSTTSSTPYQKTKISPSGKIIPAVPASRTITPTPTTTTEIVEIEPNESYTPLSGSAGGVALSLLILLGFVTWKGYTLPFIDSMWNKKEFNHTISGWLIIGAILFIAVITAIASTDEGEELAWLLVLGMWLIFIMFNGSTIIQTVFDTLSGKKPIAEVQQLSRNRAS